MSLEGYSARRFDSPHQAAPRTHLLANGDYSVMITAAGSGYSRWRDIAVTRWREDPTCDPWGSFVFLRDVANGQVWSAGYQPVGREPDSYEVAFFEDRAEINRKDGPILTASEILVSPEDDAEVRRISVTNTGKRTREIELTTYAEVVLATAAADSAHPAFSKMFVQTEFVAEGGALLATRRKPRARRSPSCGCIHVSALEGEAIGGLQFETDRARFLGRGQTFVMRSPSSTPGRCRIRSGTVLDPVLALRRRVRVAPGETARVAFWSGVAGSRAQALALADKHRDIAAFDRDQDAGTEPSPGAAARFGRGLRRGAAVPAHRRPGAVLRSVAARPARDSRQEISWGRPVLWSCGISGDLPIVLLRIDEEGDLDIVKQLLRAHEYWRLKRLAVDLVILNDHSARRMRRNCSRRWMPRSGPRRRAAAMQDASRPGSVFCAAQRHHAARRAASYCRPRHARSSPHDWAALSEQLARLREPRTAPRRRPPRPKSEATPRVRRARAAFRASSSSTASAASPPRDASTSPSSRRANGPPRPGSTSSRIRISAFWYRRTEPAAPGR